MLQTFFQQQLSRQQLRQLIPSQLLDNIHDLDQFLHHSQSQSTSQDSLFHMNSGSSGPQSQEEQKVPSSQ